ncbi:hypothetical protein HanHA300_Chr16g0613481 [Helianthus annuus]|nr:hypothetical protein HanHA300_Chr16g0613481 [Helianthus annuus]KAJ0460716.1 hypothetical protein HanHA89_Chr16g0664071 [Helianthus annuus]KAJ0641129.1 hypothetical protein HanLR1_Chr16g0623741 [Helianthus annuus]
MGKWYWYQTGTKFTESKYFRYRFGTDFNVFGIGLVPVFYLQIPAQVPVFAGWYPAHPYTRLIYEAF